MTEENRTIEHDASAAGKDPAGTKYDLKKLRANSRVLFGVSEAFFTGAVCGLDTFCTGGEVRERIKKWSRQEVV